MARKTYSRKLNTERKKNVRRTALYSLLSLAFVAAIILFGIPLVVRYTGFISDISSSNTPFSVNDQTPPSPPRLDISSESTNRDRIDINGSSEPGSTVTLRINNKEIEVLANNEGRFSTSVELSDGNNVIRAKAKDKAGNESSFTEEITIIYDLEPPELEILQPSNGSTYYGQSQKQITIEGTTENSAKVTINERVAIVNGSGRFSRIYTLTEGENKIAIKVEDEAGNTTESEIVITYSE